MKGELKNLLLSVKKAAAHLGCSPEELSRWIKPDRTLPLNVARNPGMRLWSGATLDAAKLHVEEWRQRDRADAERRVREFKEREDAQKARRKGMRKGGALTASKVCIALECTLTELNRWAHDGRLSPDGELFIDGSAFGKSVNACAWLPATIEAAKAKLTGWREQDVIRKRFKRRGLALR